MPHVPLMGLPDLVQFLAAADSAVQLLQRALETTGLSAAQLAAESGVTRTLVNDYLAGRRTPSINQLERLLLATGSRLTLSALPHIDPTEAGRRLVEVLELADALPQQHAPDIGAPGFRTILERGATRARAEQTD